MQYMGSKSRFAKDIVPIIQNAIDENDIENYYELFVGGANIIDKVICKNRFGTDINKYLIELLIYVRDNDLSTLPNRILFEEYDKVRQSYRKNDGKYPNWYKGFVGFCASYGNRFFDGGYARNSKEDISGERTKSAIKNLKEQAPNLKGILFAIRDYKLALGKIKNSVIYLDPPYKDTKQYSDTINYEEFYNFCRQLKRDNNIIFISEYNMPDDFKIIWEKETTTTIDKNANIRDTKRVEKLFTL